MRIKMSHPEKVLPYLKQHIQMDSSEIINGEIHFLNAKDGAAVNQCMFQNGDIASEISFHQLDLEEYFMNLMGGEKMRDLLSLNLKRVRNLFRMDLHRMLHGKAFYVMICIAVFIPVMMLT